MTFKEKLNRDNPRLINDKFIGGCLGCPHDYGYEPEQKQRVCSEHDCYDCWNREMDVSKRE